MTILVITTGGTIGAIAYSDPINPPINVTLKAGTDKVVEVLKQSPLDCYATRCLTLEQRDSKLIDDVYRANLRRLIAEAPEDAVMITHGTDRILRTADYLYEHPSPKTVLLTGAMTPLANGEQSDGYRNLAYALDWLSSRPQTGVFIVLCDGTREHWHPRLYEHRPGRYEKFYDIDGRYNKLI